MGIERTKAAMADADLLLIVLDGSIGTNAAENNYLLSLAKPRVIAQNKCDLEDFQDPAERILNSETVIRISAKHEIGLDLLQNAIVRPFLGNEGGEPDLLITDARHYDLLCRARDQLESAQENLMQMASEELVLVGLRNGLDFLGEISGETTSEKVLTEIFATFCIGK